VGICSVSIEVTLKLFQSNLQPFGKLCKRRKLLPVMPQHVLKSKTISGKTINLKNEAFNSFAFNGFAL
jgi:hypothetical protein